MDQLCHACGYDRSGDRSPVCPECGAENAGPGVDVAPISGLALSAAACAFAWLLAYRVMVIYTYSKGVYIGYDRPFLSRVFYDRGWRIAIALGAAASVIVLFLLWRRRVAVARWPKRVRMGAGILLLVAMLAGFATAWHVVDEASARY